MESADCLCLNCEDLIPYTAIEPHSRTCDKVADHIYILENSSGLKLTHFKLEKLKCSIESAIQSDSINPDFLIELKKLLKVATDIILLSGYEQETVTRLMDYKEEIDNIDLFHSPFMMIYTERLKNLCMIKIENISDFTYEIKDTVFIQNEIFKQNQELNQLEKELKYYKSKVQVMETLLQTSVLEIHSNGNTHVSVNSDSDFDDFDSSLEEESDYDRQTICTKYVDINLSRFETLIN